MLKQIAAASLTVLTICTSGSLPIQAQPSSPETSTDPIILLDLNRAKNLARQAAENANGGLENYRAEPSMHGPASESPYSTTANGNWIFTLKGRRPESDTLTIETIVTVSKDGNVTVDYNGPIRSGAGTR